MKKLNNKGFTLVEILAVIVILGILTAITIPTVTTIIEKNTQDNIKNLEKTIISAAKMYISDNRYEIKLDSNTTCSNTITERNIKSINANQITESKIPIQTLITTGYIKGTIIHPETKKNMNPDKDKSYIVIKYDCNTKDYKYGNSKDNTLKIEWNN